MDEIKTLTDLKQTFVKYCINAHPTYDHNGKPISYRRDDLSKWADEARKKGEAVFYTSPVDENNPYGELKLSQPVYFYKVRPLSEKEYENIFGRFGRTKYLKY